MNGCELGTDVLTVTVRELPVCQITGNDNVCPASTNNYSAIAGMGTYQWTISGDATISGAANGQTVTVVAGPTCGTFTLALSITDTFGCSNTCDTTFNITDTEIPTVTGTAEIDTIGCEAPAFVDPTATDNCGTPALLTGYPQTTAVSTVNCTSSQTRTWIYVDACGNQSAPFLQTISWTQDTEVPQVTGQTDIGGTGCNSPPAFVDPVATDNCGVPTLQTGYPQTSVTSTVNCIATQTRTWVFVDACGNESAPFVQTITWTQDIEAPTATALPDINVPD
jgi:hypothetical protein